ncbi:MAG: SURF1 family protein [Microbacteriaceae bacterium]|nr:SURF1 family protein [Microbacteriaceae bacterium]
MSDRPAQTSLERRRAREVEVRRPGALERKTVAVYDTVTDGMVGWEFVRTRRWFIYIAAAVVFAIACVFLSHWQLDRGQKATTYNARVQENFDATPVALPAALPKLDSYRFADDWKRVSLTGTYLIQDQLFVRTRPCGDATGFEVLTPLRLADGSTFVVDRGCIDAGSNPERPRSEPKPPTGAVSMVVRLQPSEARRGSTPAIANQIESIDLAQIKQRIGGRVYTGAYGVLDTQTPASQTALGTIVTSAPTVGTAIHWSYMVQWVLFALIGFGGLAYAMRTEFRRINADDPEERRREHVRRQKAARKKFTDAEAEDEILDGYVPLSRWGLEATATIGPAGATPRPALAATPITDEGEQPTPRSAPRRTRPEVIVIRPADAANAGEGDDSADRPEPPTAGSDD